MKKRKGNYILTDEEFKLIYTSLNEYSYLFEYVKQKVLTGDLINTNQIVAQYHITRYTLYRLAKSRLLNPVLKYRTYYFDANEVKKFFAQYRNPPKKNAS